MSSSFSNSLNLVDLGKLGAGAEINRGVLDLDVGSKKLGSWCDGVSMSADGGRLSLTTLIDFLASLRVESSSESKLLNI